MTFKDKPLSWGVVQLTPEGEGRVALGEIQRDGTFQLTTLRRFDGAIPGTYKVTFQVFPFDGHSALYGRTGDRTVKRAELLPEKYTDPKRTDLMVIVGDRDNHLELRLTD